MFSFSRYSKLRKQLQQSTHVHTKMPEQFYASVRLNKELENVTHTHDCLKNVSALHEFTQTKNTHIPHFFKLMVIGASGRPGKRTNIIMETSWKHFIWETRNLWQWKKAMKCSSADALTQSFPADPVIFLELTRSSLLRPIFLLSLPNQFKLYLKSSLVDSINFHKLTKPSLREQTFFNTRNSQPRLLFQLSR